MSYRIPDINLTDNVQKIVTKYFISLCNYRPIKNFMAIGYPLQTSKEAERYDWKLLLRPLVYVAYNEQSWEIFFCPFTNQYKWQTDWSTSSPLFASKLTLQQQGSITNDISTELLTNVYTEPYRNNIEPPLSTQFLTVSLIVWTIAREYA